MTFDPVRPLAYAVLCGLTGMLISGAFIWRAIGDGWGMLVPSTGLGSFAAAWFVWAGSAALRARTDRVMGAILGVLTAIVAQYASWYILIVGHWLCAAFLGRCRSSIGDYPANPIDALVGAGALTLWSVYLTGLVSLPAGATLGALSSKRSPK